MKIAFLGNFDVPFSSENHHAQSLESLGHEVIKIPEQRATVWMIQEETQVKRKVDLFIWVHTHGWKVDHLDQAFERLRRNKIPIISYHLDLYMGIERWNEYKDSPLFDIDHFFTVDPQMAEWLTDHTRVKGHFIPAGVYDKECYISKAPTGHATQLTRDIIFVGSRGYHHEWPWRPQLIDWLKETYGNRFQHWGGDGLGTIRGDALNKLYASTKIVIGDTLSPNFDYPNYFSDRLFETTGRGGFIIFPYIKGIEDYFKIGKELVTYEFGDFKDLERKINYYLVRDYERERIRLAGHERTKKDHTYKNRWQEILKILKVGDN